MGRPSKYDPKYSKQVVKLCRLGATDKDLADFFETSEQTINAWKKDFPEFLESLKRGKIQADANVAHSLYRRAIGYHHADTDIKVYEGNIIKTPLIKHYPPDSTAAIFWLKNRKPDKWRDRQEHSIALMEDQIFVIGGKEIKF